MPTAPAALTVFRTALTPSLWPATRGMPREVAQRPFPSMMMATWRGRGRVRMRSWSSRSPSAVNSAATASAPALSAISRHFT